MTSTQSQPQPLSSLGVGAPATPTEFKKSPEFTNGMNKAPRDVAWYQAELNKVPKTAQEIFKEYSGIPEEEILDHIHRVRDQAWEILPYPCIGLFRFLDLPACLSPVYPEVLSRVRAGETFLDLGCCFGQDIRKLVHDGASSENIVGVDTESRFIDLGYELFRDSGKLKAQFRVGDVFAPDFLEEFWGKIDIIFIGSFLHLFSFEQQTVIVSQLLKLLRNRKNSLVFGRHMAMEQGGTLRTNACGWSLYHHSDKTIRELWDTAPEGKWEVASNMVEYRSEAWDNGVKWQGSNEVKQQYFSARRLS
ncbi:methyltransferase domain-containing protein [Rutstroemia sp. NJR-2017a WRK4]|nr:methyltransferase domain-containing protein [Rutstroemia sp. NJR-2017a WRK4]